MFFFISAFQISLEFRNLAEKYQTVIADICRKMGMGMAEFLEKHVTSEQEWDKVSVCELVSEHGTWAETQWSSSWSEEQGRSMLAPGFLV